MKMASFIVGVGLKRNNGQKEKQVFELKKQKENINQVVEAITEIIIKLEIDL